MDKETENRLEAGIYVEKLRKYLILEQTYNMTHNKIIEDILVTILTMLLDKQTKLQDKAYLQPTTVPNSVRPNQQKHAMPEPRKIPPPPPLVKNEDKKPFANYRIWDNTSIKTLQQIHDIALEFIDIREENVNMLYLILKKMGYAFVASITPHRYNEFISELNKYEKQR